MDVERLHAILAALPEGAWVSYGDLGKVIGTGPRHVGNHLGSCGECPAAHHVLRSDGTPGYDAQVGRPVHEAALVAEGVAFRNGRADRRDRLDPVELRLIAESVTA